MRGPKPKTIVAASATVAGIQRPPTWLSRDAKAEWKRVMPPLVERQHLTEADLGSLENYCVSVGRVREIERQIQKAGDIAPVLFRMQDKAIQTARQLAAELGLTPVSRSRPSVRTDDDTGDDSPFNA